MGASQLSLTLDSPGSAPRKRLAFADSFSNRAVSSLTSRSPNVEPRRATAGFLFKPTSADAAGRCKEFDALEGCNWGNVLCRGTGGGSGGLELVMRPSCEFWLVQDFAEGDMV
jgi:hypothetical protein